MDRPFIRRRPEPPACNSRKCCTRRATRPVGFSVCAAFCVCLVCSKNAAAQAEEVDPIADESGALSPREEAPALPSADPQSPQVPQVTPPRVLDSVDASFPEDALAEGHGASVELFVTVQSDGTVGEVDVASSGGSNFDEAAILAVKQWRFEPASRDGLAIDSRIRIPFRFVVPEPEPAPEAAPPVPDASAQGPSTQAPLEAPPIEVVVKGERELRTEERSVSDFVVERDVLAAAPRKEGAEVLRSAPGVYIGRSEGPAVAHTYMLRGFDAEHGQDIEFVVGGLPINLPSHIHGQGYADLNFLIADTVSALHVTEGVSDPRQGDFAVAGSINVSLGVAEDDRGVTLRSSYGSFDTFRQLVLWAPKNMSDESFGAAQYTSTEGFGENRAGQSGSGVFQHRFGTGDVTYRAIGILHAARSDMAGVVRKDDVESGRVCFTCVYPYSTARSQNALAQRFLAGLFADYQDDEGANGQLGFFVGYDNFRIQENFTGFLEESRTLERVGGLGDLIEQTNRTLSLGLTGRYRTSPFHLSSWAHGTVEVGADGRLDSIEQTQNLLDATAHNQTWDTRVDAGVESVDLGVYGDLDWSLTKYFNFRLGLRADVLSYNIEDRLGNFAPSSRSQDAFIPGFRRSAQGVAWGPRTSLEVVPLDWLSVLAAYGEGYRSPQARQLDDGESAPFSKVRSADLGVKLGWGRALQLSLGGYYTQLSDDVAFDASEGRLERIGATQRLGAVAYVVTRPLSWLVGSASVTVVEATLLEPPPPSADEPQPPFEEGQSLPYVPPVVLRVDLGVTRTLVESVAGKPLEGRAGFGLSYLSARPLPYGDFADPFALLDASAGLSWGMLDLSLEVFNLLNSQYAAVEYSFPSDWDPDDGVRSRTPEPHTAAGSPLSWMLSLGVTL